MMMIAASTSGIALMMSVATFPKSSMKSTTVFITNLHNNLVIIITFHICFGGV